MIAEPVRYRARRILFAYSAEDFSLFITDKAGPGVAGTLAAGLDLGSISQAVGRLTVTCLAASGVAILVVACLAIVVIRAILRPLTRMQETAEAIAAGQLSHRVPGRHARSDAGRLACSLNTMLNQIEHAFSASAAAEAAALRPGARMRETIADTGQELRRPLSVIRGIAAYYRQRGQLGSGELDRMMKRVEDEAARIGVHVDTLLLTGHDQPPAAALTPAPNGADTKVTTRMLRFLRRRRRFRLPRSPAAPESASGSHALRARHRRHTRRASARALPGEHAACRPCPSSGTARRYRERHPPAAIAAPSDCLRRRPR